MSEAIEISIETPLDEVNNTETTPDDANRNYVIKHIEQQMSISYDMMKDKTRKQEVVIARHLAMYFIRITNSFISLKGIGEKFGNRDHSSVIHAIQTVEDYYDTDRNYRAKLNELCMLICPNEIHRLGTLTKEDVK